MLTLNQGKAAALEYAGAGLEICSIHELPDKWVFGFRNAKTKEYPDTSPVSVDKEAGSAEEFFPPDHMDEFLSMKEIEAVS